MKNTMEYEPAAICDQCKEELNQMEAKLSQANHKDIILVAYEKK